MSNEESHPAEANQEFLEVRSVSVRQCPDTGRIILKVLLLQESQYISLLVTPAEAVQLAGKIQEVFS